MMDNLNSSPILNKNDHPKGTRFLYVRSSSQLDVGDSYSVVGILVHEATVEEWSPSGIYVKLRHNKNDTIWRSIETAPIRIIELLEDIVNIPSFTDQHLN